MKPTGSQELLQPLGQSRFCLEASPELPVLGALVLQFLLLRLGEGGPLLRAVAQREQEVRSKQEEDVSQ